jgi:hypothetical protein
VPVKGFSGRVLLADNGAGPGLAVSISPAGGNLFVVRISAGAGAEPGTYAVTLGGVDADQSHLVLIAVHVI